MTTHSPLRCANSCMIQRGTNEVVLMDTGAYPGVSNFLNETWKWNGTDWTAVGTTLIDASGPLPGRLNMVMAYDGTNVMLFGGQGDSSTSGVQNDTWTWNGTAWTKASPATSPFGRYFAEACRTTTTASTVTMFGGFGGAGNGQYVNETWLWNGTTWALQSPATSPSARIGHCMDCGTTFTLMFGGSISSGEVKNDTWKWDGTTWTQLFPVASPSARTGASMTFDRTNNVWVMFGGMNEYYRLPETWTYNAGTNTWTLQSPTTSPPGLTWSQMCWDTQSGRVLLFGGMSATDNYATAQTWSWNGTNWTLL